MHLCAHDRAHEPVVRSRLEVAEILRRFGPAFRADNVLTLSQVRTLDALSACRTAALGGHLEVCDTCDFARPAYNSCGNRHCPKCQALSQARWIEARMARVLPTHYFHVVFTLPSELRPLVLANRRVLYDLLFETATKTLLELAADPKWLGAQLGITAVLHSWARDLSLHPHLHCIVTGGGLTKDGEKWVSVKGKFLLPRQVVARKFRGKFLARLTELHERGQLRFAGGCAGLAAPAAFAALKDVLYGKKWVIDLRHPFGGPRQVYSYLGRYTHLVGLSNARLQAIEESGIRFATRDGKSATLPPPEFIRRLLLHILPSGFKKIRHYGLSAPANVNTRLERAKALLGGGPLRDPSQEPGTPGQGPARESGLELLRRLTGVDLRRCPACRVGMLERQPLARDPPPS
jgi:hypothetical protein